MQRTEIVRQDDKNIIDPFLRHTKSGPTDVAIIDGAEVLTYQELWRLSKYVVHSLWDFGIRKGDRVAYFLPNGVDLIVLYLAIQAMGAVAVPVNYRFTSEEVGCLVNASDAEALIYAPEHQSVAIDARKGFDHAVQILSSQFIRDALSDMRLKQLAEKEGMTEALKAENQMLWVQKMNSIRNTAMEIVSNDLIYA